MALSRAAMNSGLVPLLSTTGGAASLPSRLSLILTSTTSSCGSLAPAGTVHSCASRARNASSSLSDSCAAAPFDKPSEGALLSVSPAAASRVESRLSSNAATCLGSNLGVGGAGFFGGVGGLTSAFFGSGFLASSFASASAIGSGFASACFFSGSDSAGFASGAGGGSRAALTSFFSTTFAVGSSTGFASATFSTSGFGVSAFGASLLPAVILEKSDAVTRSTGRPSVDDTGSDVAESDHTLHSNTAACPTADMVYAVLIALITRSARRGLLLALCDQRHAAEAGGRYLPHHLHDRAVVDLSVATHENALLCPAAGLGDGLELGDQFLHRSFGILEVDLPALVDRNRQRLFVLIEGLGLGLRQVEGHSHRQKRGRHHENDQQDQHDVDHRRHVDLGHDRATAMPPAGDRGSAAVHRHLRPPIPVRRSAAIESRRTRRRTPPGAGPACSRRTRTCYRKWSPVWRR